LGVLQISGEMARGPTLAELIPDKIFLGTSLILRQSGGTHAGVDSLLYGVRAPRVERGQQVLEVTGIGGALEDSDASPTAGVLREALEETGCDVRLLRCRETLVVHSARDVRWMELSGAERPAAVVFRHHNTPPREPWSDEHSGRVCVVVFAGKLSAQPRPAMELPALIWLTASQVVQVAQRDILLQDLLDSGAGILEGTPRLLPRNAWLRLVDSQEALVLALGDNALPFYAALFEDIIT
jgi:8-oxo-dGTP pyrophosphatase MutT (NUDIX family)